MFSAAASGVLSMLKTSTDSGDIGDLSFNTNRLPSMPRPAHRRRANVARLSASSYHSNNSYTPSQISKRNSNSQAWDAVSAISQATQGTQGRIGQHGSLTSLQTLQTMPSYAPDNKSPRRNGTGHLASYDSRLTAPFSPDGRSYSLTQPQESLAIKPHRSAASLRSQGSGPYPSQRQPYAYPTRLKRPGFRAPLPAPGEFGYASVYSQGPTLSDSHPFESGFDRHQGMYGPSYHPLASQRAHHGASHRPSDGPYPPSQNVQHGRNIPMRRPPLPTYNSDYAAGPQIPRYSGQHGQTRQPAPNMANLVMDQNQYGFRPGQIRSGSAYPTPAYGASHPPPRLYTPQVDSLPSSSEPGSSAPPSSSPPTPKEGTAIQVSVESSFIDHAFGDVPDEQTEPHGYSNYLKYSQKAEEIFELDAAEPAAAELAAEPTPTRAGFVQRIKDLLEDRAHVQPPVSKSPAPQQLCNPALPVSSALHAGVEVQVKQSSMDLPATRTSDTEHEPVELPTTRTSVSEPVEEQAPKKLTRALIKVHTAPSSSDPNTATSQPSQPSQTSKLEHDTRPPPEDALTAHSHQDEQNSDSVCVSIHSSPPQATLSSVYEDNTVISKDLSGPDDMTYTVQVDIPIRLGPEMEPNSQPEIIEISEQQLQRPVYDPVSPLRPSNDGIRDSMVSPLPTQTSQSSTNQDHPRVPGSFPEEEANPPSPVSRPMSGCLTADTSTRFSMPPDPSLLNDQDVTSDVVTDVAVRFSVPRTADHGKPQIVSVSTTVEPTVNQAEAPAKQIGDSKSLRESFFNVERIAPLQIKKPDTLPSSQIAVDSTDLSSFIRRSFPRRQSIWSSDRADSKRLSSDSTTEIRFPGMKVLPGHLPGLKEESLEDMSIKGHRSSGLTLAQPPALPPRVTRDSLERTEDRSKTFRMPPRSPIPAMPLVPPLPSRAPRMTLSELRNIPSLHFSRLDLIDKLNEALESQSTKSVGGMTHHRNLSGIYCPYPLRPSSTESLRERYTSFFAKPEEFRVPESILDDITDDEGLTTDLLQDDTEIVQSETTEPSLPNEVAVQFHAGHLIGAPAICTTSNSLRTQSPSMGPLSRPLSPEELLGVALEVNRLSVPSVAALSERLSALFPSIRHLTLDSTIANDNAVRETIDEIHHLGQRFDSDGLLRASTGLRQMAAMADTIVTNGTHDSAAMDTKSAWRMRELPPLPEDMEKFSLSDSGLDKNTSLGTEVLSSFAFTAELALPQTGLLRVKSFNDIDNADLMHPGFPSSATKRSLAPSTHHSRPWNLDEYYPWTGKSVNIDIEFPKPILRRNTSASTVLRKSRLSTDESSETSGASGNRRATRGKSPLGEYSPMFLELSPTITTTTESRKTIKRSIMGSLTRRMGLGGHKNKSSLHTSMLPDLPGPTRPGDRYPSTALLAANAFQIDEVRSFFSDSTSNKSNKRGSFRKHVKILRSRLPGGPATLSASRLHSIDAQRNRSLDQHSDFSQPGRSTSLRDGYSTGPGLPQAYDGTGGMGKVEFRVKRVTERLRHVLLKTGEMIRTFSHKGRPDAKRLQKERERAEWLDDSLYSGT